MAERAGNLDNSHSVEAIDACNANGDVVPVSTPTANEENQTANHNAMTAWNVNIDVIRVTKGMCNDTSTEQWELSEYQNLRELIVEDACFRFVAELRVSEFAYLERMVIGDECFDAGMGVLEISHCEVLRSVRIGKGSFVNWSGFVLQNCGVEEVEIGEGCFVKCEKVVFDSERIRRRITTRSAENDDASSWKGGFQRKRGEGE